MTEHPEPAVLQLVHVPGLRVALVAISAAEAMYHPAAMPIPLPLGDEVPHPLPAYLPAGLRAMRLGEGYCAIDLADQFQVTWIEVLVPAEATLSLPWDLSEGPAPAMQGFQFRGSAAVALTASWSMVSIARLPLVITRASPDMCWLVGGKLAIDELAQIAVSLPG